MKKIVVLGFFTLLSCSTDTPEESIASPITYTLIVSASEGGTTDNTGGTQNENIDVIITAIPAEGYIFSEWSGSADGTTNPLTVSMSTDKSITANFTRIQYTLNLFKVGEGTISQEIISAARTSEDYNVGTSVRLNATPSSGWIFSSWSGSSTSTANPIDLIIDKTKTITATFVECTTVSIGVVGNTAPLNVISIDVTQVGCDNTISIIALNIQNIQPPLGINWFQYKATTVSAGTGTTTTASTFDWIPLTSLDQNTIVSELPEGIYRAEVSDGRSGNCGGILRTRDILLQESSIDCGP